MRPDLKRESLAILNDSAALVVDSYANAALAWVDRMIQSYERGDAINGKKLAIELINPAINYSRANFKIFINNKFEDFLSGGIDKESTLHQTLSLRYNFLNTLSKNCNGDFDTEDQITMFQQTKKLTSGNLADGELEKQITNHYQNKIKEHLQEISASVEVDQKTSAPRTLITKPQIQEFRQADIIENQL